MKENNGIGFLGILFFVFLVLKLTGQICWSWWWVAAPLWMPTSFVLGIWLGTVLTAKGFVWYKTKTDKRVKAQFEEIRRREEMKKKPRTFAGRLKEMQEGRERMEAERRKL